MSFCDDDLQNKLHKFQYMCGTIKRNLINKTRKDKQLKFYKVMAVPVLLYGCENWPLNRVDRSKTETTEMKSLRRVAGYTLRDEVTNTAIRELQIFNIGERIQSRKIERHEHLSRMEQQRIAQQVMFYKPIGYRDIGRPRRRWEDTF
jgi:hypothetical protein